MRAKENTKYALISNGAVANIFTNADIAEWNEDNILAIEITPEQESWVEIGTLYDDAKAALIEPTLEEAKTARLNNININFEYECDSVKGEYVPQDEIMTWTTQEAEATAYKASQNEADCPMLAVLAKTRGVELGAFVEKVLEKASKYRQAITLLTANRQALQDKVEAATTKDEVASIVYTSPLGQ